MTFTFRFTWKLINSDIFEQDFEDYSSFPEAYDQWFKFWDVPLDACEKFTVEVIYK